MSLSRRIPESAGPERSGDESSSPAAATRCDRCGARIVGEPASRGLFLWARGEEIRFEEPPLCARCTAVNPFGSLVDEEIGEG